MELSSPITEFFAEKTIFLTGATGFMGKVLVEKLLRSCPKIRKIYVLLRSKQGQTSLERKDRMLESRVFDRLRDLTPCPLNKVVALQGDISSPDLGLSPEDTEALVKSVAVIYHSAATVKFDETLRVSVQMNLMGTKHVVDVAKKFPLLQSFVHVSTAYCNCDRDEIDEIVYPPPVPPQFVMDSLQWMDDTLLEKITPRLIKGRPNTYTFTKALAESYLSEHAGSLPIAIVRPSIVTAGWKEPFQGWIDNLNGPTGMYVAAIKGILRTMLMEPNVIADYIPVDIVINLMIVVAYETAQNSFNGIKVYNCTSGGLNCMTWKTMEEVTYAAMLRHPSTEVYRYPIYKSTASRWALFATSIVHHYIPASLVDFYSVVRGKKPRMIRLYNRIHKAVSSLDNFTMHEWKFVSNNIVELGKTLSAEDLEIFDFDIKPLDWSDYMNNYVLGIRRFILKEDEATLPIARKSLKSLYWKSQFLNLVVALFLLRVGILKSSALRKAWYSLVSYILKLYSTLLSIALV